MFKEGKIYKITNIKSDIEWGYFKYKIETTPKLICIMGSPDPRSGFWAGHDLLADRFILGKNTISNGMIIDIEEI